MKKFLKILLALIVVAVLAVVALITLVDPNEYRGYMVQQVEEKTGYKLQINGDLRWHIWPQISILVDGVTVTAPGAKEMMAKAENMRLDVELMPLLSKQLSVKEVLVKGAVIRLTDDTKAVEKAPTPTNDGEQANTEEKAPDTEAAQKWSLGLNRFEIADSMFILQQSENRDDLLTVRNINVLLTSKGDRQVDVVANSSINRNLQDISASVKATADLKQFPNQVSVAVNELNYQLSGAGFPQEGIKGSASAGLDYDFDKKAFSLTDLKATANDASVEGQAKGALGDNADLAVKLKANAGGGVIDGEITGTLGDIPDLIIKISGTTVNVDTLTRSFAAAPQAKPAEAKSSDKAKDAPVAAKSSDKTVKTAETSAVSHELAFLNGLNAKLNVTINSVIASGMTFNNVVVDAENKQGSVQLKKLSVQTLGGSVSAPGSINAKGKAPYVQLNPKIEQIDMDTLSKTFDIPQTLSGKLNMNGKLSGSGLSAYAIKNGWNAELNTRVDNARLNNINLKQIIHQAAALSNKDVKADERYEQYTEVRKLSAMVLLQKGNLRLNNISVDSEGLTVGGSGTVGLAKMQCDVSLSVKLMQGWQGKKDVVDILQSTSIPVHIYGPCSNLSYKVDVEKIIKDQLKNQASKVVDKYLGKSSSERTDAVANKILGQITGKKY
jgi:AsmA protein